jgi:P-type Cu+ transporter
MSTVAGSRTDAAGESRLRSLEFPVSGMTCSSCAARVEKKLNRLDGVTATVNFATETALVSFPAALAPRDIVAAVEQAGYAASLPAPGRDGPEARGRQAEPGEAGALRQRLLISMVLAVPVVALAMVPAAQFRGWQWVSLSLATPVAVWGAWPFHRAAVRNARHGAATMDTLISIGVGAAYLWSLFALLLGSAGRPGMHMTFAVPARAGWAISTWRWPPG